MAELTPEQFAAFQQKLATLPNRDALIADATAKGYLSLAQQGQIRQPPTPLTGETGKAEAAATPQPKVSQKAFLQAIATRPKEERQRLFEEAQRLGVLQSHDPSAYPGVLSGLYNAVTEFISPDPPGGPRRQVVEPAHLPRGLEAAFQAFLLTAAPTAGATGLAQQFAAQSPRLARLVPLLTEMASSFLARKANVATSLEAPGVGGDVAAVALPAATRGVAAAGRRLLGPLVPPVSKQSADVLTSLPKGAGTQTTRQLLETGTDIATTAQRGEFVRRAMRQAEDELKKLTDTAFGAVRQKVQQSLGHSTVDVTTLDSYARSLGTTLDMFGVETTQQGSKVLASFDDALKLSSRLHSRVLRKADVDRIGAAGVRKIREGLEKQIAAIAGQAGALGDLQRARRLFASDVVPRFRTQAARRILDDFRTSGEELITRAPRLTVRDARNLRNMIVHVEKQLDVNGRAVFTRHEALEHFRTGVVARLVKMATQAETGNIQPRQLLQMLRNMEPEAQNILLGAQTAKALQEFAGQLSKAQRRLTLGLGAVGTAGLGTVSRGGAFGSAGSLEAANELNMLGRMVVGNPVVFRRIMRRVLDGEPDAIRTFTSMTGLRIMGEQAARTPFSSSETAVGPQ